MVSRVQSTFLLLSFMAAIPVPARQLGGEIGPELIKMAQSFRQSLNLVRSTTVFAPDEELNLLHHYGEELKLENTR